MAEWRHAVVSCVSAQTTTINDVPTVVAGYYVNTTLSAHQAELRDGSAHVFKTEASLGVGLKEIPETRFENNCVVVCAAGMSGNLTVLFRDLERT